MFFVVGQIEDETGQFQKCTPGCRVWVVREDGDLYRGIVDRECQRKPGAMSVNVNVNINDHGDDTIKLLVDTKLLTFVESSVNSQTFDVDDTLQAIWHTSSRDDQVLVDVNNADIVYFINDDFTYSQAKLAGMSNVTDKVKLKFDSSEVIKDVYVTNISYTNNPGKYFVFINNL